MLFQLILFLIFVMACCTLFWKNKEHFWFIPEGISICDNVINLPRHHCKRCTNAGYCTFPNGEKQCVPGDSNGPYNGQDCTQYEYGNMANLSLIDPQEPMWVDMNNHWDWVSHLGKPRENPRPTPDKELFFRHGSPPQNHHRRLR